MKKKDTILLPVGYDQNGVLTFLITYSITQYAGQYEIVILTTEQQVVDGNIDEARQVFVSTVMNGVVEDNPLVDPVVDPNIMDKNLQVLYDDLLDLFKQVTTDLEEDAYRGAAYIPTISEDGVLSFTRDDGKDINIPEPKNLTGPTGPYYMPNMTEEGVLEFDKSAINIPDVPSANIKTMVEEASNTYLSEKDDDGNTVVDRAVNKVVDAAAEKAVDAKFKFT
jgi:hypothetical protein